MRTFFRGGAGFAAPLVRAFASLAACVALLGADRPDAAVTPPQVGTPAASIGSPAPVPRRTAIPSPAPAIAFVPLDDRPVTLQLPLLLGRIAGQPLAIPSRAHLGRFLSPGDPDAIATWLASDETRDVSALVVSSDMALYGGLVASRVPGGAAEPLARVDALAAFRQSHPRAYVATFGTVMRLAPTGVPSLADAWITGATVDDVQAYANLPDPPTTPEDRAKARRLRAKIGVRTLDAYLEARARNLLVDRALVRATALGGFDRLVLGQDDAGPTGLHLRDLAALRGEVARDGATARVAIEPGADELGMALLARVFARNVGWSPRVRVVYSRADAATYNDRLEFAPIDVTIYRLIEACGGRRDDSDASDVTLFVRAPGTSDADEASFEDAVVTAALARPRPLARVAVTALTTGTSAIEASIDGGGWPPGARLVAVADLTFLDGEPGPLQRSLTDALVTRGAASRIDGYASWNTTANTVGTTLAEAIAVGAGHRAGRYDATAQAEFLLDRYVDDYAFHQFVRPAVNAELRARHVDTELLDAPDTLEASSLNRSALWPHALDLLARVFPAYRDAGLTITLPWDRTFETQIDVALASRPILTPTNAAAVTDDATPGVARLAQAPQPDLAAIWEAISDGG